MSSRTNSPFCHSERSEESAAPSKLAATSADPRALLLAVSINPTDAEILREQGIEVHTFEQPPSLKQLAAAALDLRKRHPRLLLLVSGPRRLVEQLQQRYPPLVDVPLDAPTAQAVLAALSL